ncbi:ADP-ribosylation factor-binding protein GGA1 [Nymphon striatum]|nr:ADP-ribosylation factor-binding protein GGA1 [Nymphon striatum]
MAGMLRDNMASLQDNPLEYWLAKSTNLLNTEEDVESIKSFCEAVNKESDGPNIALRLISHKIQSPQEREALQALSVLENCVKTCDYRFHQEIGKFRFLNEMVKIVSPKYLGLQTSEKVKKKVIELLYEWMITLKNEPKISEAYAMLKKQGVVTEDPVYIEQNIPQPEITATLVPRSKNAVFEDQEKSHLLHKLLQSKNPEDLQAANRLIKSMVKEDEKRTEKINKRVTELETAATNTKVLSEMLENFRNTSPSPEDLELMKELYESCEKLRPALFRLAAETDEGDDSIADILRANDEVTAVMSQYKLLIDDQTINSNFNKETSASSGAYGEPSLLELTSPEAKTNSSFIDDQLLGLGIHVCILRNYGSSNNFYKNLTRDLLSFNSLSDDIPSKTNSYKNQFVMDQLGDLFNKSSSNINYSNLGAFQSTGIPPMKPVPPVIDNDSSLIMSEPLAPLISGSELLLDKKTEIQPEKRKAFEGLDDMIKSSLPSSNASLTFPCQPSKTPMNQMQKKDDEKLILAKETPQSLQPKIELPKSLDNIKVQVQNIKPASIDPLTLLERDGVTVAIHFTLDKPREDVNVMVATAINKSYAALTDYIFSATVSIVSNIRVENPSTTSLPAFNPILPPAAITTVILVSNPSKFQQFNEIRDRDVWKFQNVKEMTQLKISETGEAACSEQITLHYEISYLLGNTKVSENGSTVCSKLS